MKTRVAALEKENKELRAQLGAVRMSCRADASETQQDAERKKEILSKISWWDMIIKQIEAGYFERGTEGNQAKHEMPDELQAIINRLYSEGKENAGGKVGPWHYIHPL